MHDVTAGAVTRMRTGLQPPTRCVKSTMSVRSCQATVGIDNGSFTIASNKQWPRRDTRPVIIGRQCRSLFFVTSCFDSSFWRQTDRQCRPTMSAPLTHGPTLLGLTDVTCDPVQGSFVNTVLKPATHYQ